MVTSDIIKVCIIGNGNTSRGAQKALCELGITPKIYTRSTETKFREDMFNYDVIVNCVLWDTKRTDHLIRKNELHKFKPKILIIDVSCDPGLGIESTKATTIQNPIYEVDGIMHYAVANTPALDPLLATQIISKNFKNLVDEIVEGNHSPAVSSAVVIRDGKVSF